MKKINLAGNERGVALMMVLVISAIVLVIMSSMIYMLTTGTKISGISKRYTTATEAAEGGITILRAIIDRKDHFIDLTSDFSDINLTIANATCAQQKLQNAISEWTACSNSALIDIYDSSTYDFSYELGDYRIYAKLVYTGQGNSHDTLDDWLQIGVTYSSGIGRSIGSTTGSGGEVPIAHFKYFYNMEVDARNMKKLEERARLSMLYQF